MAALAIAVFDVVVHEAEVVAELDCRGPGQRLAVVAGYRRVGKQAEQRTYAFSGHRARAVEAEVIAHHLVYTVGRRVTILDQPEDLLLGVRDERGDVELGCGLGHLGPSLAPFR